ncbi:HD domain-containing protein [Clostridium sp. BSD9I1]|uniref:HD domain-containing protein n=1 Tax=Clostridium sp. BSD9I1 TaxID=2003589 RepID=UPI001646B5D8|nr:HD domain-containing protein [Clostridium sp. BSD9I1]
MNSHRIKQFYLSITDKINEEDKAYINKYLNKEELSLFYKLSSSEQKHSVRVAYDVEYICNKKLLDINEIQVLIRAALLHDIGKIYPKLNSIDKSLLVILNKITNGNLKKFNKLKKIDVYYNHPEKGYNLLMNKGYDSKFLYLIKNHHKENNEKDLYLEILKFCDDKN